MQLPLSFQIQNHGRQLLRQTLDKYYAVGESSDAVTLAWNFFMAEVIHCSIRQKEKESAAPFNIPSIPSAVSVLRSR